MGSSHLLKLPRTYNFMPLIFRSQVSRLPLIAFAIFFSLSLASRLALFITAYHNLTWGLSILGVFASGLFFDAMAGLFATLPWFFYASLAPGRFLGSRIGRAATALGMLLFTSILLFITASEWFFWDEFGARFNFIAVDYLIWTQEVLGNISESYPMIPILSGIITLAGIMIWTLHRRGLFIWAFKGESSWKDRAAWLAAGLTLPTLAVILVSQSAAPSFANQYHAELAKNGCWSFFAAFKQMELDYPKWYVALPEDQMRREAKALLATKNAPSSSAIPEDFRRTITAPGDEHRWNVILICMESMSANFMDHFGKKRGLTPNLDRIAKDSIFFENIYATGTRTVRGMEAITLGLPPTPGQAIIYRPGGVNLVTSFTPFLDRGYDCAFFYGGDGRFDFMNRYFSTAGCRVMDAGAWKKQDISFKTAWGACDEDLFHKAISEADANHAANKPFHFFCMTTSNHRPYTFPDGRIDLPSHSGRKAAVKYADWAVGNLIAEASQKPWFKDTLFVFVADHCAGSAGKSEIDVTQYRIPAMIYNPSLVPAKAITGLSSQVDLMPTLFGQLNWNYQYLGYGHDKLDPANENQDGRAFVSNYQKIALLTHDGLAILKPNRQVSSYSCDLVSGDLRPLDPVKGESLVHTTTIFYQSASWLFKSGRLQRSYQEPTPVALESAPLTAPLIKNPATPES